jgi:hypothetical protein
MITLTTAAWITFALVTIIAVLMMKATIPLVARQADNGWDNAVAYVIVSGLIAAGLGWLATQSWMFAAIAPLLSWAAQTLVLRHIYEVRTARAWLVGIVHAFFTTTVVTTVGLTVAFVAAYILYGKIISDPMFLIRLLARLIGIELPF